MKQPSDIELAFNQARKNHFDGHVDEAEQAYRQLMMPGGHRKDVLDALAQLYLQTGRPVEAADTLAALTEELPDELYSYARLATILDSLGQTEAAIGHYRRLLARRPELAAAYFNVALLHKKARQYDDAIAAYDTAIRLKIDHVQEVYSNMGVLFSEMHLSDKAREMYELAVDVAPDYAPALFNLAGLCEERGDRNGAIEFYNRILSVDPHHWDALTRLAYCRKVSGADNELIGRLESAIRNSAQDSLGQEGLYFALGKVFDELGQYDEAFATYTAANILGKQRNLPYDPAATELAFDQLIRMFDSDWIRGAKTDQLAAPIFICGMYRSGSTLIEQILAAHPSISGGGELDILPWLVGRQMSPYPHAVKSASSEKLQQVANEYLSEVQVLFPKYENLTDKRPDNFLHLGLIKVLFPAAKIIFTKREMTDNCLSIFFQQFGGNLNYATDLENIAHYRRQHDRLMNHWGLCLGDEIFSVDYDELVGDPETVLRKLVEYLGVDWDDSLLSYEKSDRQVKTASVWQVRESIHSRSSGRRRNYESHLKLSD